MFALTENSTVANPTQSLSTSHRNHEPREAILNVV